MGRVNKPAIPGYTYRSAGQTNARDLTPSLEEDVIASQTADTGRIRRGLSADAERAYNRRLQQEAGGRALLRTAGRAAGAAGALQGGYDLGREIDERTGIGRKIVDATVGEAIDREVGKREGVKLTKEAQERVGRGETEDRKAERKAPELDEDTARIFRPREIGGAYKKGGAVTASKRADGIAQRGKTRGTIVMCKGGKAK